MALAKGMEAMFESCKDRPAGFAFCRPPMLRKPVLAYYLFAIADVEFEADELF